MKHRNMLRKSIYKFKFAVDFNLKKKLNVNILMIKEKYIGRIILYKIAAQSNSPSNGLLK